jgi:hypothetical protein
MRSAVAFLCFCTSVAAAAAEQHSRKFNGVTASFTLLNPSLRAGDPLKVRFTLFNESDHPVTFRYYALFLMHVEVFTARGERVPLKMNAPTFEPVAAEIPLRPHEKIERTEKVQLSTWYGLAPGNYYLIFRYDLRDLPGDIAKAYKAKLRSEDFVTWDAKKYPFHIRR